MASGKAKRVFRNLYLSEASAVTTVLPSVRTQCLLAPPLAPGSQGDSLSKDFAAGVVVFLVALPLCLGIALASGAPLLSGLIAGIVGGIVVGIASGSHLSVTGPADS